MSENQRDRWDRHGDETRRGENNNRAKLTEKDVRAIRASSLSLRALADKYGTSKSLMGQIKRREVWAHVA